MNHLDFRKISPAQKNPLVTIGILSYNNEKYILECLESIKNQTYYPIQVIINDDFSKDNSNNIIEKWISENDLDVTFLKSNKNYGISSSCNKIVTNALGEYITLIGSDDYLSENRIELCVKKFSELSMETGILYTDMHYINEEGNLIDKTWSFPFFKGYCYLEYLIGEFRMPTPTLFYRSKVFDNLLFDQTLAEEDIDFQSRALYSWRVDYVPEKTVYYRHQSSSSQIRQSKVNKYELKLLVQKRKIKHLKKAPHAMKKKFIISYLRNIKNLLMERKFIALYYAANMIIYFIVSNTFLKNFIYSRKYFFYNSLNSKSKLTIHLFW